VLSGVTLLCTICLYVQCIGGTYYTTDIAQKLKSLASKLFWQNRLLAETGIVLFSFSAVTKLHFFAETANIILAETGNSPQNNQQLQLLQFSVRFFFL